jgi:hypothetical protein
MYTVRAKIHQPGYLLMSRWFLQRLFKLSSKVWRKPAESAENLSGIGIVWVGDLSSISGAAERLLYHLAAHSIDCAGCCVVPCCDLEAPVTKRSSDGA